MDEREYYKALRRLAILESSVLQNTDELLEWYSLRRWVLAEGHLEDYISQHYFACSQEITQNGYAPKNLSSIFSRFLDFIFRR